MELSRRDVVRAGGLLGAAGLAGCVQENVTRRETRAESSTTWALNPAVGMDLTESAFETYVEEMADRYGDSGVWGIDGEAERGEAFETAYVQRLGIARETPAEPGGTESSLDPDEVDPDAPLLFVDAAVAVYNVEGDRYRYWTWIAADADDDRLVRDVGLTVLGSQLVFRSGALADTAQVSTLGDTAAVTLGGPPNTRFPLNDDTREVTTNSQRGAEGFYFVDWAGDVEGVQSVNGVCEEERAGDHDFFWGVYAGHAFEETV